MASQQQMDDLKAKLQAAMDAVAALPVEAEQAAGQAADGLSDQLKALQDKFDALGKERDAYKAAIQTEIDDSKADSDRLEKAIAPVEPVEVPVVTDVVKPADQAPAADAGAQPTEQPKPADQPVEGNGPDQGLKPLV